MNGMMPYVDFVDSKGPLLWLINGIAYLLSHHNYLGVFWLECLFHTITVFFCYKIGCLFLSDQKLALLGSLLMAIAFFCGAYHYETSAEDFCQPFITGGLFYTLRVISGPQRDKDVKIASFVAGVGFAATLLIKFTIAAMILIFFFTLFCYLIKRRKDLIGVSFIYALAGILLILSPFVLYFAYKGSLGDFIYEYFIATTQTVVKNPTLTGMIKDYIFNGWGNIFHLHILRSSMVCFLLLNILLGCVFFYKRLSALKWFPAIMAIWFICISMYHNLGYYYQSFVGFAIFPVIMYLTFLDRYTRFRITKVGILCCAGMITAIVFAGNLTFTRPTFFLNESKERTDFYYVNRIMSQVTNPTIVFSFCDFGYGTPVHALPGCKYWTRQVGATDVMRQNRALAIQQQLPDFVIYLPDFDSSDTFKSLLQQSGYLIYYEWTTQKGTRRYASQLYGKQDIILPPKDIQVSAMDILLKKRIIPR
jgi:hypothetical protein